MARQWGAIAAVCAGAMGLTSCGLFGAGDCLLTVGPMLTVEIRDRNGRAQGVGSTVTLVDGDARYPQTLRDDSLRVTYFQTAGASVVDVVVSKPFYQDAVVRNVRVSRNACRAGDTPPVTLPVVLALAPSAPAVRSAHLLPPRILLDREPYTTVYTFTAVVDANPGISTAVRWRLDGDTSGVSLDAQTGTVRYRCQRTSTYPTLQAIAVADTTVVATAALAIQGHPAAPNDPPCS